METLEGVFKLGEPGPTRATLTIGKSVINLSSTFQLDPAQQKLLEKGLSFIPTPVKHANQRQELLAQLTTYHRRLKLHTFFRDRPRTEPPPFRPCSAWEPGPSSLPIDLLHLIDEDRNTIIGNIHPQKEKDNLSQAERQALASLEKCTSIIIKPADKGGSTVIQDKSCYIQEALRQLNDTNYYIPLETAKQIDQILNSMVQDRSITKKQQTYLTSPSTNTNPEELPPTKTTNDQPPTTVPTVQDPLPSHQSPLLPQMTTDRQDPTGETSPPIPRPPLTTNPEHTMTTEPRSPPRATDLEEDLQEVHTDLFPLATPATCELPPTADLLTTPHDHDSTGLPDDPPSSPETSLPSAQPRTSTDATTTGTTEPTTDDQPPSVTSKTAKSGSFQMPSFHPVTRNTQRAGPPRSSGLSKPKGLFQKHEHGEISLKTGHSH